MPLVFEAIAHFFSGKVNKIINFSGEKRIYRMLIVSQPYKIFNMVIVFPQR